MPTVRSVCVCVDIRVMEENWVAIQCDTDNGYTVVKQHSLDDYILNNISYELFMIQLTASTFINN